MSWTRSGEIICDCCGKVRTTIPVLKDPKLKMPVGYICKDCWETVQKYGSETD